jgi:F0F1-type ATP synthase assembly protein I
MRGDDKGAEEREGASAGRSSAGSAAEFAGLGLQFAIAIVAFLYAGRWLDARLGTAPLFLILGVFVGAGGAFYSMYRRLTAAQRRDRAARRK